MESVLPDERQYLEDLATDLVGKAKHTRFIVELAKQKERLEAKAAKLAALGK